MPFDGEKEGREGLEDGKDGWLVVYWRRSGDGGT